MQKNLNLLKLLVEVKLKSNNNIKNTLGYSGGIFMSIL